MLDDPHVPRAYAHPATEQRDLSSVDDLLPHPSGPLRLYAQRLLLLILICYTMLALLFIASSQTSAAPLSVDAAPLAGAPAGPTGD